MPTLRQRPLVRFGLALLCLLAAAGPPVEAARTLLGAAELRILGVALRASPAHQVVPLRVPTVVEVPLVAAGDPNLVVPVGGLPGTMRVKASLSGPGLTTPLQLECAPGDALPVPALAIEGQYAVDNIRLMDGEELLFLAEPSSVTIAAQNILASSVRSRPLTLEEIEQRGIVIDPSHFQVLLFTVDVLIGGNTVQVEVPTLVPLGGGPPLPLPRLMRPLDIGPTADAPVGGTTSHGGFEFQPFQIEMEGDLPPPPGLNITAALSFPQSVGYLDQFLNVLLLVTNAAPGGSPLEVRNLTASFTLPGQLERVRTVPLTTGTAPVPVRHPGADGELGTADDLSFLIAAATGRAEMDVRGLGEGTHRIDIELTGTVAGLPGNLTAPIAGHAAGVVQVRNPSFNLTFLMPSVVEAGQTFEIAAAITNTSDVDANLLSVRLPRSGVAGAQLIGNELHTFNTLPAGESATARYTLLAGATGQVVASRILSPAANLNGRFEFTAAINGDGAPISPDVLVLPPVAYHLDEALGVDLVQALLSFLASAWSNATAPPGGLPPGVAQIERGEVMRAAAQIADAGQRLQLGESELSVLSHLWLRLGGNDGGVEDAGTSAAFDQLRRRSVRWQAVRDEFAAAFVAAAGSDAAGSLVEAVAEEHFYLAPMLLVGLDPVVGDAIRLELEDASARLLSASVADLPRADRLRLDPTRHLAMIAAPSGPTTVRLIADADSAATLTLIAPYFDGTSWRLNRVGFGPTLLAGDVATVVIDPLSNSYQLSHGTVTVPGAVTPVTIPPLAVTAAYVGTAADPGHHVVAVLFNRPVDPISAKQAARYTLSGVAMADQAVQQVLLQGSGRFAYLVCQNPVPPTPLTTLGVDGVSDRELTTVVSAASVNVVVPEFDAWGTVVGTAFDGRGQPIPGLRVFLSETVPTTFGGSFVRKVTAVATTNNAGQYRFHFARKTLRALELRAFHAPANEQASAVATVREDGQVLMLDLRFLGRGDVRGRVVTNLGQPVQGVLVSAFSVGRNDFDQALTDASGRFLLQGLVVGAINLSAQSAAGEFVARSIALPNAGAVVDVGDLVLTSLSRGEVRGRVTSGGQVVAAAPVVIRSNGTSPHWGTWMYSAQDGVFAFANVPVGQVTLSVLDPQSFDECGRTVGNLAADEVLDLNLLCVSSSAGHGTIVGRVVDGGGLPLGNVPVQATGAAPGSTLADGTFRFDDVPTGSGTVRASAGGRLGEAPFLLAHDGQLVDVTVRMPAFGSIQAVVTDGGSPVAGAVVRLVGDDGWCTTQAPAGSCTIDNVPLGSYVAGALLEVAPPQPGQAPSYRAGKVNATVRFEGDIAGIEIALPPLVQLEGIVEADGQPLGGASLSLLAPGVDGDGWAAMVDYPVAPSAVPDGDFLIENVASGPFTLVARDPFDPNREARLTGILTGDRNGIVLAMADLPEPIAVTVELTMPDFGPVPPGQNVDLVLRSGELGAEQAVSVLGSTAEFTSVPQGRVWIRASTSGLPLNFAAEVTTIVNDTANQVALRLLGRGTVTGRVVDGQGAPIPNAAVVVRGLGVPSVPTESLVATDANGEFAVDGVREGWVRVVATEPPGVFDRSGTADGQLGDGLVLDLTVSLAPTATISGTVRQAGGVLPAAGVAVFVSENLGFGTRLLDGTTTAADGSYSLGPLVHHPGGTAMSVVVTDVVSGRGAIRHTVLAGADLTGFDLRLGARGNAEGFVLDSDGVTPLPGVQVRLNGGPPMPGLGALQLVASADAAGYYRFVAVSEGDFSVVANKPATVLDARGSGRIRHEGDTDHVDLTVEPHGTVAGRVLDELGNPVAAAVVLDYYPLSMHPRQVLNVSAADGLFSFANVPLVQYHLRAIADGPLAPQTASATDTLTAGGQVRSHDLALPGTATVNVTVTGGTPPTTYDVTVEYPGGASPPVNVPLDSPAAIPDVVRGPITVTAFGPGASGGVATAVIPAGATSIDLIVPVVAIGAVSGVVRAVDGVTPVDAARVQLAVTHAGGTDNLSLITGPDGAFLFPHVRTQGALRLDAQPPTGTARARFRHDGLAARANPTVVDLRLDNTRPLLATSVPAPDAVSVAQSLASATLTFNEPMDGPSLSLARGGVRLDGTALDVAVTGNVATVTLPALISSRQYTLLIASSVENANGLALGSDIPIRFTTIDNLPASVSLTSPSSLVAVPLATPVRVTFSELMQSASLASAVTMNCDGSNFAFSAEPGGVSAIATVTALPSDKTCTVQVTGALDLEGNPTNWTSPSFTTADTIPPTISSLSVSAGPYIEGAAFTASVTVDDATAVDYFIQGQFRGNACATCQITLQVPTQVAVGGTSFELSAVAIDDVGNRSAPYLVTLAIDADQPPTVTITAPSVTEVSTGSFIEVVVHASDSVGLTSVSFQVDGLANQSGTYACSGTVCTSIGFGFTTPANYEGDPIVIQASALDSNNQVATATPKQLNLLQTAIAGTVYAPDGITPAADVSVTITGTNGPFMGVTDANGEFQIGCACAPNETYTVDLRQETTGREQRATTDPIVLGEVTQLGSITLIGGTHLVGTVTVGGEPLVGGYRILVDKPRGVIDQTHADSDQIDLYIPVDATRVTVSALRTGHALGTAFPTGVVDGADTDWSTVIPGPVIQTVTSPIPFNFAMFPIHVSGVDLGGWFENQTTVELIEPGQSPLLVASGTGNEVISGSFPARPAGVYTLELRRSDGGFATTTATVNAQYRGLLTGYDTFDISYRSGRLCASGSPNVMAWQWNPTLSEWQSLGAGGWGTYTRVVDTGEWVLAAGNTSVELFKVDDDGVTPQGALEPSPGWWVQDLVLVEEGEVWALTANQLTPIRVIDGLSPSLERGEPIYLGLGASRVVLQGDRLFVASVGGVAVPGGLRLFDVSNRARPVLLGEFPGSYEALAVSGDQVVGARIPARLDRIDFTAPHAPTLVASTEPLTARVQDLVVSRGEVWASDGTSELRAYAIDDLTLTQSLALPGGFTFTQTVALAGTRLLAAATGGVHEYEPFTAVASPRPGAIPTTAVATSGGSIVVTGEDFAADSSVMIGEATAPVAFVGDGWLRATVPELDEEVYPVTVDGIGGVELDVTDEPRLAALLPAADGPLGGGTLNLAGSQLEGVEQLLLNGVEQSVTAGAIVAPPGTPGSSLQISLPGQAPIQQKFVTTPHTIDLLREGPFRYSADHLAVAARANHDWIVATDREIAHLGSDGRVLAYDFDYGLHGAQIFLRGSVLVGHMGTSPDEIKAYDVSDAASPTFLGRWQQPSSFDGGTGRSVLSGERLYTEGRGCVFDVSGSVPTLMGCAGQHLGTFAVAGDYVAAVILRPRPSWAPWIFDLVIFDYRIPSQPSEVGRIDDFGGKIAATGEGNHAYFVDSSGIVAVDLTNPSAPSAGARLDAGMTLRGAAPVLAAGRLYCATDDGGLYVATVTGTTLTDGEVAFGMSQPCSQLAAAGGVLFTARRPGQIHGWATAARDAGPHIDSINPSTGPNAGGAVVHILGRDFTDGASVTFCGTTALAVDFIDPGHLRAISPAGLGMCEVTVSNPNQPASNSVNFEYLANAAPAIAWLSPASGPLSGGNTVSIHGWGLGSIEQIRIEQDELQATATIESQSATTLSITVPAAPSGRRGRARVVAIDGGIPVASLEAGYAYMADIVQLSDSAAGVVACGGVAYVFDNSPLEIRSYEYGPTGLTQIASKSLELPSYGWPRFLECANGYLIFKAPQSGTVVVDASLEPDHHIDEDLFHAAGSGPRLFATGGAEGCDGLLEYDLGTDPLPTEVDPAWSGQPAMCEWQTGSIRWVYTDGPVVALTTEQSAVVVDVSAEPPVPAGAWVGQGSTSSPLLKGFAEPSTVSSREGWSLYNLGAPTLLVDGDALDLDAQAFPDEVQFAPSGHTAYSEEGYWLHGWSVTDEGVAHADMVPSPVDLSRLYEFSRYAVDGNYVIAAEGPTLFRLDARSELAIDELRPERAGTVGGREIRVFGHGLDLVDDVRIGGVTADYKVMSSRELRVIAPGRPSPGMVEMRLAAGPANATAEFTYQDAVEVRSMTPDAMGLAGGEVTVVVDRWIEGAGVAVTVAGAAATNVTGADRRISFTAPAVTTGGARQVAIVIDGVEAIVPWPLVYGESE